MYGRFITSYKTWKMLFSEGQNGMPSAFPTQIPATSYCGGSDTGLGTPRV